MKKITILTLAMIFYSGLSQAQQTKISQSRNDKICNALYKKAYASCYEVMCEDYVSGALENGEENPTCEPDGDFYEGHGICVFDDELPSLIEKYNKKNPNKNINCDGVEYK